MNVYNQTRRKPYLVLTFDGGSTVVQFDNMEINRQVQVFTQWYPEIFQSAGGIATKLARRQPRRVRFQVRLHDKETICKLNTLVAITATRYRLRFCMYGYWDCTEIKQVISTGGVGNTGTGNSGNTTRGNTSLTITGTLQTGGNQGTGLLTGGVDAAPGVNTGGQSIEPQPGDQLVVGTQVLTATAELLTILKQKGVAILPFCMDAVLRYDKDLMYLGQGRGLGVNANTYHEFEVLESRMLPLPLSDGSPVGNDPNTDPGNIFG